MTTIPEAVDCSAYQRGHQPHYIQARLLRTSPDYASPVMVREVEVGGPTELRVILFDGSVKTSGNHQPARARAAWKAHPEGTVLYPGKDLLGVRHPQTISGQVYESEYLFSLCFGWYRTCEELAADFRSAREGK